MTETTKKLAEALRSCMGSLDAIDFHPYGYGDGKAALAEYEALSSASAPEPATEGEQDLAHRIAYAIQQNYLHELADASLGQIKAVVSDVIDEEDDALTVAYLHGVSKGKASAPEPVALTDERAQREAFIRWTFRNEDVLSTNQRLFVDGDETRLGHYREIEWKAWQAALAASPTTQQPVALTDGMPGRELDALLDHIHEYGTQAEGVRARALSLCKAYALAASPSAPVDAQAVPEDQIESLLQKLCDAIKEGLDDYRCTYIVDADDGRRGMPLADMLTLPSDTSIKRGQDEIVMIADAMYHAIKPVLLAAAPTPTKGEANG